MARSLPTATMQWNVTGSKGAAESLKFSEQKVPELGDGEALVKSKY